MMTKEEAIDWLQSRKEHWEMDDDGQELAQALQMGIEALENQKTGHWVAEFVPREQPDNWDRIAIKCSECGVVKTRIMYNADTMDFDETVRDYTNTLKKNHYCFNCGAKMVESQEREGKE